MSYDVELRFFQKLLHNLRLPLFLFREPFTEIPNLDLGLHALLNPDADYSEALKKLSRYCQPNIIYRIADEFLCRYILFRLPDTTPVTYVSIGPYSQNRFSMQELMDNAKQHSIPLELFPQLEDYYRHLPFVSNEHILLTSLNVLGESIWGSMDHFCVQNLEGIVNLSREPVAKRPESKVYEEALLSMQILEERYAAENFLMQAVSQGQTHKAEMYLNHFSMNQMEQRLNDPIQDLKNYTIILNTLLRKAAEAGTVHPLHIDSLSSRFARKIAGITSAENAHTLQREMVHKYCLLVKNHSMKGYSLLIQKVLTRIDSDLTADLSLSTQAELLNVNSSYLSTLFKKETGLTLTEYVNRRRIEHGIFLLNSTHMQVQTIALYCGFPDVNYFTKTFKKLVGKTPKEYRDSISIYP